MSVDVHLQDALDEAFEVLDEVTSALGASSVQKISSSHIMKLNKDPLSHHLKSVLDALAHLTSVVTPDFKTAPNCVKTQMFESQQKIIDLQSELLSSKNEQLDTLKASVTSSVQETVKAEFVTYSSKVQSQTVAPAIAPETVRKLIKTVVQEEDRSRSLMVFGLPEEEGEQLTISVGELFQEIGEKPRVEASRLGQKREPGKVRPVKVTVTSSTIVDQILAKARNLKQSERHSSVFICPDRSPIQRAEHRRLVAELRDKVKEDTTKRHFIRGGKICSSNFKDSK